MNKTKAALVNSHAWSAATRVDGGGAAATSPAGADIAPGGGAIGAASSWAIKPVHIKANKKNE
jgi:hypothetical protein